jgi:MYXO-CTERM domain-containing protein
VTARCDGHLRDACVETVLCTQNTTCDGDHHLIAPGQVRIDCSPYRCDPAGVCRSQCSSSLECANGNRCTSRGDCVRRAGLTSPGCACRAAGGGPGTPGALFALGLLLLRRRRPARCQAR